MTVNQAEFTPLDGALLLASRGEPVIQLRPRTKIARHKEWPELATTDIDKIKALHAECPDANYASVAKAKHGGVWFLEVDSPEVVKRIESETGQKIPKVFRVRSRKGRGHYHFKHDAMSLGMGNISQSAVKHRDFSVRTDNAYCVGPYSYHPESGTQYELLSQADIIEAPVWLIDWLKLQREGKEDSTPSAQNVVREGSRNSTLASMAGSLRRTGLTAEEIEPILLRKNEEFVPPLGEDEVRTIAGSIGRYEVPTPTVQFQNPTAPGSNVEVMEQIDQTEIDVDFQIIGAEKELTSDTLFAFSNESDAKLAESLGFESIAVLDGKSEMPFMTSVTLLKIKYSRIVIFGSSEGLNFLRQKVTPGSISVFLPLDLNVQKDNRRGHPEFASLMLAKSGYTEVELREFLESTVKMQAVQSCIIVKNAGEMKARVTDAIQRAKDKLASGVHPRIIVTATMDDLRHIEFYDDSFPKPLTSASLSGLLGEFVEIAYPTSQACREMMLYGMLPLIGVALGSSYYVGFGSDRHFPSIFNLTIARTSDGKGQATSHCREAISLVDPLWAGKYIHENPASGEGLVRMLGSNAVFSGHKTRIAIINEEMATCFQAQSRENATLSGNLRKAFDGVKIENFRSESKKTYTAAGYILGFLGMITPKELKVVMPAMDWTNGAANRFLWNVGFGDKELAISEHKPDFSKWAARVSQLVEMNKIVEPTQIFYTKSGGDTFRDWRASLPKHDDDSLSESQARSSAICARLANLYAQLDERRLEGWQVALEPNHIEAASDIIRRSRESVENYLAQSMNAGTARMDYEDIMKVKKAVALKLREGVGELTASEVLRLFRHKNPDERDDICIRAGLVVGTKKQKAAGRPGIVWRLKE